jgi:hypothetical protein
MFRRLFVPALLCCSLAFAQAGNKKNPPPLPEQGPAPNPVEFLSMNFGASFVLMDKFPVLTADLDGDGLEDAVFVVTRKDNPLLDEEEFHYKVIDPYDEYFGFGDPKVTVTFNAHDPEMMKYIAIVHAWRIAVPRAKFVVINLPFEKLSISRIPVKKKKFPAVAAEDLGGLNSAIYWDGKKYRWDATPDSN